MAILDTRSRSGYLFLAVAVGHIILISAQVNTRSGVPVLQAVLFGALAEVQRGTSGMVDAVRGGWDGYVRLGQAQAENVRLEQEVADLRIQLQLARAEAGRTGDMRRLLDLRDRTQVRTRAAEIIGTSATTDFKTLTIDRGTADGVLTDMAVVSPAGAVGRVVMPTRKAAKVQLIIDRSAAVAVVLERSRVQGVAFGTGDSSLRLEYLPSSADCREGDLLTTSGIDGIYPPGFQVGRIDRIERAGGTVKSIRVAPTVRFGDLESVLVVTAPAPQLLQPTPPPQPQGASE